MKCPRCETKAKTKLETPCKSCQLVFCSFNCMINHYFDIHKTINKQEERGNITQKNKQKFTNSSFNHNNQSPFIIDGTIFPYASYDKQFSFENLDKVYLNKRPAIIGSGSFCKVILYKSKLNNRFYAVKHMPKETIMETCGSLSIIHREIDYHSRILHDNIIRLFYVQENDAAFDLVLEYANGGSLFDLIQKTQGLSEDQAFLYFIQACAAVHFLHSKHLIHRDIKPENLLLDENGQLKLCDFGWCSEIKKEGRSTFCGTIEYMAPEIVKEIPYDKSIDIWALGVLLYEMLHGYSPFKAKTMDDDANMEVFKNILDNKLVFNKNISVECKQMILKMIEPDKAKRLTIEDVFAMPFVKKYEKKIISNRSGITLPNEYIKNNSILTKPIKDFGNLFQLKNTQSTTNKITSEIDSDKIKLTTASLEFTANKQIEKEEDTYSILDQISKKYKSKAKKNPKYTKPITNLTSNRFLNMTMQSSNKSFIKLDEDNINNQIFFNKSSHQQMRSSKTSNKEEHKALNMTTRYETSRDSLIDAFTLIDMTSNNYNNATPHPPKQEKRHTFWQSFVNSFKCE